MTNEELDEKIQSEFGTLTEQKRDMIIKLLERTDIITNAHPILGFEVLLSTLFSYSKQRAQMKDGLLTETIMICLQTALADLETQLLNEGLLKYDPLDPRADPDAE